ncbi:MAG: ABC transporter substrate-binding protein [Chloroflexi bacterium]|nr:ABC transporter substrate-binding protein [Chloroflexota bacterium]
MAAPTVEKPKYGGVLKLSHNTDIIEFDDVVGKPHSAITMILSNENSRAGDWAKGPAGGYGSNEADWNVATGRWELLMGYIAESWEIPTEVKGDAASVILHIRKGIRWALNPDSEASRLVNGRELTADDVAFSIKQNITVPGAYTYASRADLRVAKVTAPDKWTVKIEFPWDSFEVGVQRLAGFIFIKPPEVFAKWGDNAMADWKKSVGTGPFMLTEVVPGSSATLIRNPNYWGKNPAGPGKGDQLPYLDGVKLLILPDRSTRYAALRTAKIDWTTDVDAEDFVQLKKGTPQLISRQYNIDPPGKTVSMRVEKKPFDDIRVRRAMMMAIDFEAIKRDFYGGNAQILTWPIGYFKEYAGAYLGLDDLDMPASVRELYSYNPDKAKQLLKEAGYPNGFKTWIDMGTGAATFDYFSLYKDMWAKIGVQVEFRPSETAAQLVLRRERKYEQMMTGVGAFPTANLYKMNTYKGGAASEYNLSMVDDPYIEQMFTKIQRALVTDRAEANRLFKEHLKYVLNQAWVIPAVQPPEYTMWWPWLKNYSGEHTLGYNNRIWPQFVWLDQELKKSMGY